MAAESSVIIYVLHFERPMSHARHYIGSTPPGRLQQRVREHQTGRGANICRVAVERGIGLVLAATMIGTRSDERRAKASHGPRLCPLCGGSGKLPTRRGSN